MLYMSPNEMNGAYLELTSVEVRESERASEQVKEQVRERARELAIESK